MKPCNIRDKYNEDLLFLKKKLYDFRMCALKSRKVRFFFNLFTTFYNLVSVLIFGSIFIHTNISIFMNSDMQFACICEKSQEE